MIDKEIEAILNAKVEALEAIKAEDDAKIAELEAALAAKNTVVVTENKDLIFTLGEDKFKLKSRNFYIDGKKYSAEDAITNPSVAELLVTGEYWSTVEKI